MKTKAPPVKIENLFRAVSDRTRLRILNLLRDGELCVCDLVDLLDVPQPTASRHLAYLRKTNLVAVREDGRWAYYRLATASTHFHEMLLQCLACCPDVSPQFAKDTQRLRNGGRSNCCE
jgi:ArsR family transcriptional regulator